MDLITSHATHPATEQTNDVHPGVVLTGAAIISAALYGIGVAGYNLVGLLLAYSV
ncbi:hypothetical protein [Methylorubrum sp. SB2]|uniref:hypothetical protein n=1 Tax=Methylorubrum subtropicum TaxID=3138812 RepID=UPI00313F3727